MNEQFNNFMHDAILHLNKRKIANLLFPNVKLLNRIAHLVRFRSTWFQKFD